MFWGLIMEPRRRYTQVVQRPFHVSMAALDIHACDSEPTQVMLYYENRNYLICTLHKDNSIQCSLDLNFKTGDKICFATNGGSNIHLSGYLHEELDDLEEEEEADETEEVEINTNKKKRKVGKPPTEPPQKKSKTLELLEAADNYDSADDMSFSLQDALEEDSEDDDSDDLDEGESENVDNEGDDSDLELEGSSDEDTSDMDKDDDDEGEDDDEDEEVEKEKPKPQLNGTASKNVLKKAKQEAKPTGKLPKPGKGEKTPNKTEVNQAKAEKGNKSPKGDKTPKENKTPKNETKQKENSKTPNQQSPSKRILEGNVIVQDLKVGDGPGAKPGKLVEVYYEGRLKQNNKLFDQNKKGNGFRFRLGKHEVIKGWDVGVAGMQVGGRRRIICPPPMAYGQKGSPPVIPSNSTLIFEVELKNIL